MLKFLLSWVIQPIIRAIVSQFGLAFLIFLGLDPFSWLSDKLEYIPYQAWVEIVRWLIVTILVIWFVRQWWKKRTIAPILQVNGPIKAERDVSLFDAIWYLHLGKWEKPPIEEYSNAGPAYLDKLAEIIHKEIRQLAYEGKLTVWGKISENDIWQVVPQEHWKDNRLDWFSFLRGKPEGLTFMKNDLQPNNTKWIDLKTSKVEIEGLWPTQDTQSKNIHKKQQNLL
jgi:hypothetical protein